MRALRGIAALIVIALALGLMFEAMKPRGTDPPTATAPTPKGDEDYQKVVNNEFGRMTLNGKGGALTSVKLETLNDGQKEKLQEMLLELEVPRLVTLRACSFILTFGGLADKGEIHNCEGDRVGSLSSDAVGYLRDGMVAKLKERAQ